MVEVREDPRPARAARHVAGILAAGGVMVACAAAVVEPAVGLLLLLAAGVATLVAAVAAGMARGVAGGPWPCALTVHDGVLSLLRENDALPEVRSTDIEDAWAEPSAVKQEPDLVAIRTRTGIVYAISIASGAQREALVRALGLGAESRVLRVPLASALSQLPTGGALSTLTVLGGIAAPCVGAFWLWTLLDRATLTARVERGTAVLAFVALVAVTSLVAIGMAAALARLTRRRVVVVGAEGLVVEGHGRRARLRYAGVARVDAHPRGVALRLVDGDERVLPLVPWNEPPLPDDLPAWGERREAWTRRQALLSRMREALALERARVAAVKLDLLDRAGRTLAEWREVLLRLPDRPADYRGSGVTRDDLAAVAADAAATPERRIAAAYALSTADHETRHRIRVAADACADDSLRAALEAASEGELSEATLRRAGAADRPR